jgi:hypothetical protein
MLVEFIAPTAEQREVIWESINGDNGANDGAGLEPIAQVYRDKPHDYEAYYLYDVPGVGRVLGGADLGGSWDEQIVRPGNATMDDVMAAVDAMDKLNAKE